MLAGLVIGIICGVVVLGILTPFLIRWLIQRKRRRTTQIFLLPPPAHSRTTPWSTGWSRVASDSPPVPVAYKSMVSRPRALSASDPIAMEYAPSPSSSVSSMASRIRCVSDLALLPAATVSAPATPSSFEESIAITPQAATYALSQLEILASSKANQELSSRFANGASHSPEMRKTGTFLSEAEVLTRASSMASGRISALTCPATPERTATLRSSSTESSSLGHLTADTPVVSTAVMYHLSDQNLPAWNRASMMQLSQGLAPVPGATVPTAYVPYRPPQG